MKNRKCEICRNNDLPTTVTSSTLGACSFNYCSCCMAMCAEMPGMGDLFGDYTIFKNDSYMYKGEVQKILLSSSGKSFSTRSEYVDYINTQKGELNEKE